MNAGMDSVAARNRAAMPVLAAWVDELRRVFGPVRVRHLREAGLELGKPQEEPTMNADEWLAYVNDRNQRSLGKPWERP